jgi:hypothetical protein
MSACWALKPANKTNARERQIEFENQNFLYIYLVRSPAPEATHALALARLVACGIVGPWASENQKETSRHCGRRRRHPDSG